MTKPSNTQSQNRFNESLGKLFQETSSQQCLFIKSSTDVGVIRNGGRNGARFAPQSFLSTFRKWSQDQHVKNFSFTEVEVGNPEEEHQDFQRSQHLEAERIRAHTKGKLDQRIIHLGGGHDHIYPLLKALAPDYKKIIVINIDAHADTRTDENFHSGTPFRQFSREFTGEFILYQVGLHPFSNSFSTLSPLEKGEQYIIWRSEISPEKMTDVFMRIEKSLTEETLVIFSLDADAMDSSVVPGVSAVNPDGLKLHELKALWNFYAELPLKHGPLLGIYEMNPLYDTSASISMRSMASFVFETFRK